MTTIHIVGAGLAGLSAAVELARAKRGLRIRLHEAAGHAGGRCRSLFEPTLGRDIDNGNHLILGANRGVFAYLAAIGAADGLHGATETAFAFVDLRTGQRWSLRPNAGRLPWWMLSPRRRVPDTRLGDYVASLKLLRAGPADSVADCLDPHSVLFERLWEPLTVAVMNAAPHEATATLMARVLRETLGAGGAACRPFIAAKGLSPALVDPALRYLADAGVETRFGARLTAIERDDARATSLRFGDETVVLGPDDHIILAVPPQAAERVLPGLPVPQGSRAIVNVHFRLPPAQRRDDSAPGLLGLIGGTAQWLFRRGDVASVTISAADALVGQAEDEIIRPVWRDLAVALGLSPAVARDVPPARVIKERRATFLQSPVNEPLRPATGSGWRNLFLAGDWTATGLPATIEGAIDSGRRAALKVLAAPEMLPTRS